MGYNTKKMQTSGGTPRKGVFSRSTFLSLDDTPDTYVSQAGKVCVVKNDETAVEFKAVGVIDDHLVLVINTDTTPGTLVNKLVAGSNITLTTNSPTGNATITIAATDLVKLQSSSPGTIQIGHVNITGSILGGVVSSVDSVSANYTTMIYDAVGSGECLFGGRILTGGSCNFTFFPGSGIASYKLVLCYYSAAGGVYRSALEYENPTSPVVFSTLRLMKSGGTIISGANYLSIPHGSWSTVNAYYDPVVSSFRRVGAGWCYGGMYSSGTYQFYGAANGDADSSVTWVSFMDFTYTTAAINYYGTSPVMNLVNTDTSYEDGGKAVHYLAAGSKAGTPITTQFIGKLKFSHDGADNDFKSKLEIVLNYGSGEILVGTFNCAGRLTVTSLFSLSASIGNVQPTMGGVLNVSDSASTTLMSFTNAEETNLDDGRVCSLMFRGKNVTTPAEHTLGTLRFCHDGTGNDQKGQLIISLNTGAQGDSASDWLKIKSNGNVFLLGLKNFGQVGSECEALYYNKTTKEIGYGYMA